jgi:hypothetical protein
MKLWELTEMVAAICPIYGMSSDGVIHFRPEATTAEQVATLALVETHLSALEE